MSGHALLLLLAAQQAKGALEAVAQTDEKACEACGPISAALLGKPFFDNNDKVLSQMKLGWRRARRQPHPLNVWTSAVPSVCNLPFVNMEGPLPSSRTGSLCICCIPSRRCTAYCAPTAPGGEWLPAGRQSACGGLPGASTAAARRGVPLRRRAAEGPTCPCPHRRTLLQAFVKARLGAACMRVHRPARCGPKPP